MQEKLSLVPLEFRAPEQEHSIPRLLHLIWVGETTAPDYVIKHVEQWKQIMPHWTVRLWTNEDIITEHFSKAIVDRIDQCSKGAQKADLMRYHIVHRYGGVYLDTDITPHRSLDQLLGYGPFVVCHDLIVTWAYIANAFFASIPGHPVLQKACQLCLEMPVNTDDVHMQTGPRLFGAAIASAPGPIALLDHRYFYRNVIGDTGVDARPVLETHPERFGNHFYAHDW